MEPACQDIRDMTLTQLAACIEREAGLVNELATKLEVQKGLLRNSIEEQQRRMAGFAPLTGKPVHNGTNGTAPARGKANLEEAILALWDGSGPFTTEQADTDDIRNEVVRGGYRTTAQPASFASSVNQALAKLCQAGKMVRLTAAGIQIPEHDQHSRARKYVRKDRVAQGKSAR